VNVGISNVELTSTNKKAKMPQVGHDLGHVTTIGLCRPLWVRLCPM